MPATTPDRDNLNLRSWRKIENEGRQLFKLYLPRISERNGPICCYRVFLVKLDPQKTIGDLPPPEEIPVYSYHYVHSSNSNGAYLAEMFDSDRLIPEIFLGDGESFNASTACEKCIGLRPKSIPTVLHFIPETPTPVNSSNSTTPVPLGTSSIPPGFTIPGIVTTSIPVDFTGTPVRKRRQDNGNGNGEGELQPFPPQDGFLDEKANYTGFIEVIGQ